MIAVLLDHFLGVLYRLLLPTFVADMLPAGYFGKYQQSQFVTFINKVLRLRVMAGTHGVDAQLIFKYLRIEPLRTCWHCVTHIGKTLMTVQPEYLDFSTV